MAFFTIPILAPLAKALGIAGLFSTGTVAKAAQAVGIADRIRSNLAMDPNISLKARALANLPFGVGSLFTKDGKFFDPGLGSPPPAPPGEITPPSSRPPVTVENLPPPPGTIARPPPIQAVTRENLFSPGELSQFDSPSAPQDFGTDFGFNQGGLVSLLPRRATPVRSPPISYRRY